MDPPRLGKRDKLITIDGPRLLSGKQSQAWVWLRPSRLSSRVIWDAGSIDYEEIASENFGQRLLKGGWVWRMERLNGILPSGKGAYIAGAARWGGGRTLPHDVAVKLMTEMTILFLNAATNLPVDQYEGIALSSPSGRQ